MLRRLPKPVFVALLPAAIALALYLVYRLIDPLPPRHFAIAAGIAATTYDDLARQYARILARNGVELEVRNYASAVEDLNVLSDAASGVQAGITTFGFTESRDPETMYSLGGISDSPIFIFYRNAEPITQFVQFRGKRLSIGTPTTALRQLMLEVLKATGALDDSIRLVDLDFAESIDALVAGEIDATMLPAQLRDKLLERALAVPNVRIMNVAQAEAISKTVPGLKHVVLSRGLVSLARDIPDSDVNLLAIRNRVLVRKNLHPALQYLLLEAMREVHWPPGPFNRLGEFPAEQPNDLPLSPTAEAFYRSGGSFWQRYTSFWLTSLLDRIVFFVVPSSRYSFRWLGLRLASTDGCTFVTSTNCTGTWGMSNGISVGTPALRNSHSTRSESGRSNLRYVHSKSHIRSNSICTDSGFTCTWCRKILGGWRPVRRMRPRKRRSARPRPEVAGPTMGSPSGRSLRRRAAGSAGRRVRSPIDNAIEGLLSVTPVYDRCWPGSRQALTTTKRNFVPRPRQKNPRRNAAASSEMPTSLFVPWR
ncbi:MAG TPA: TAXI family TRAP transporter solute-binding subunit [Casimicrobiaceae bacterium]|nr:TAXI family TRAP transporter solute-binding subunit [Casimicrobiaceae bacterium]